MELLIFVVDNEPESCEFIRRCLELASFRVRCFSYLQPDIEGPESPSLIIFGMHIDRDLAVAGEAVKEARFKGIPRLALTDRNSHENRLSVGFDAHIWISKPFTPDELASKIKALARKPTPATDETATADFVIDSWAMKLSVRGHEIATTTLEFRLVEYLARHRGQVFTRDFLLDAVWGNMRFVNPRSVDACIGRIREKIEPDRTRPIMLKTVRGVGYRLDAIVTWQSAPSEGCGCPACLARVDIRRADGPGVIRRKLQAQTSST
jgi:DNA-binding response OmpR family regulator